MEKKGLPSAGAERWRNLGAALLLALVFALAMAALLNYFKFRNALSGLARDNVAVAAQDIEESVRLSQSLGLPLPAMTALPALLQRQAAIDPAIRAIHLADPAGQVVFSSSPGLAALPAPWLRAAGRARDGHWHVADGELAALGSVLRNDFNLPVALLAIEYATSETDTAVAALRPQLFSEAAFCLLGGVLLGGALLLWPALRPPRRAWWTTALILGVTAATLLVFAWRTVPAFERHLAPELAQKARLVGQVEAALIGKALAHGLALPELVGVAAALEQDRQQNAGLAALALADAEGRRLFSTLHVPPTAATARVPLLTADGSVVGNVEVWCDPDFARRQVRELALDLAVVLIVALFLTLELLAARRRQERAADPLAACRDVRAPAFLFFLGEETTRPFLPAFAADLADGAGFLSPTLVAGLPISLFMLIVALSQPGLGALCQRHGQRRLLLLGAATAVLGFLLCAAAPGLGVFLLGRSIGACGYAAVFVAAQNYVLERTDAARRSAGFALFVGAIMVATVCGPSVGGVVADHLGARAGFLLAASLAALALPLARRLDPALPPAVAASAAVQGAWRRLLANRGFLGLCLAAAVPAKILLTAGCFYLLPLYVLDTGGSQAQAGRLLMVYAVCMVLLMPLAARLADRGNRRATFVLGGLLLSAAGGLAALGGFDGAVAPLLVLGLGLGQALSIAAQSTLVATLAVEECAALGSGVVYGIYRLLERGGNTLGPLLAAALLAGFGFRAAFACLGALALLAALFFYLSVWRRLQRDNRGAA